MKPLLFCLSLVSFLAIVGSGLSDWRSSPSLAKPDSSLFTHYVVNVTDQTIAREPATTNITTLLTQHTELQVVNIFADNTGMARHGWDTVYVEPSSSLLAVNATLAYYAAGYAEGFETAERIYQNYYNIYPPDGNLSSQCGPLCKDWIMHQWGWMETTSRSLASTSKFWKGVQGAMAQMRGLIAGYQAAAQGNTQLPMLEAFDIYMITFNFEMGDVQFWVQTMYPTPSSPPGPSTGAPVIPNTTTTKAPAPPPTPLPTTAPHSEKDQDPVLAGYMKRFKSAHCSAMVKVLGDDLCMAQDTWSTYSTMLRQYKTYAFETVVSFSSYPATLHSGDDWYMMSTGLTSQETSLVYNPSPQTSAMELAKGMLNESVAEFVRVMVANRLAENGQDWASLFCQNNSGTYNNQYMIVDMNLFNPSGATMQAKLPTGVFWVVEQMPTMCVAGDQTQYLIDNGYWGSYNLPYYKVIDDFGGNAYMVEQYGSFFSHKDNARAEIFRRNQSQITDLSGVKSLMRYNDFLHDPLSKIANCSGCPNNQCTPPNSAALAIASRFDYNANGGPSTLGPNWQYFTYGAFGAIDAKVICWKNISSMVGHLISGPTVQPASGIKPFAWTEFPGQPRKGIPDVFDFDFVNSTDLFAAPPPTPSQHEQLPPNRYWVLAIVFGFVALCVAATIYMKRRAAAGQAGLGKSFSSAPNESMPLVKDRNV